MRAFQLTSLGLLLLLFAGCDSAETTTVLEWSAVLSGAPGFEGVAGSASATSDADETSVSVAISGAAPGAAHPWHIHIGTCETDGPIFGDMTAYPDLQVGPNGTASGQATLDLGLAANVAYFVNVHLSQQDLATIVACGNLVTAGGNPGPGQPPGNGDY